MSSIARAVLEEARADYEAAQEALYIAHDEWDVATHALDAARYNLSQATQVLLLTYETNVRVAEGEKDDK